MDFCKAVGCALAPVFVLGLMGCGGDGAPSTPAQDGGVPQDTGTVITPPVVTPAAWDEDDFDHVYHVGPGRPYADPSAVPWEALMPSTLVLIHHRDEPYAHKWVIHARGTEDDPIVVLGVPAADGRLPVIDGANAVTRGELSYWNARRSVIKVGGSNLPSDELVPAWIYIEGLEIRGAHPDHSFADDSGAMDTYADNAASVHVEQGEHVTIRGCAIHGSGNGVFSGSGSSDLRVIGNHVYGNGIVGSIYQHNSYTESLGILFEANHYGPLRAGAGGTNLKDRSAGTVIRFNWIEDGNRQLDLVETDYDAIAQHPSYAQTFVYGNVLYESRDDGNSQMIHFGGDGDGTYRGTLYLFHNTFLSLRSGNTTLVALSTDSQALDARNDLVASSAGPNTMALTNGRGASAWHNSYLPTGYRLTHEGSVSGSVDTTGVRSGDDPGFMDQAGGDLRLRSDSGAPGPTADHATATSGYPVASSFDPTRGLTVRVTHLDPGAFER